MVSKLPSYVFYDGIVIVGNAFGAIDFEGKLPKSGFKLTICDPPYGRIVKEDWDTEDNYLAWMSLCTATAARDATICIWGGTGKRNDRPFIQFASMVETEFPEWEILNWITWGKRRAYGVQSNYLYTREECLILTRGNPVFNIPLLDEKRGYAGYNKEYPAKSEYLRRTNVWTDINELFRGKIHPTQKPDALYEVLINTHSMPGDIVFDPCGGSLTTRRAAIKCRRDYCIIEREQNYVDLAFNT